MFLFNVLGKVWCQPYEKRIEADKILQLDTIALPSAVASRINLFLNETSPLPPQKTKQLFQLNANFSHMYFSGDRRDVKIED